MCISLQCSPSDVAAYLGLHCEVFGRDAVYVWTFRRRSGRQPCRVTLLRDDTSRGPSWVWRHISLPPTRGETDNRKMNTDLRLALFKSGSQSHILMLELTWWHIACIPTLGRTLSGASIELASVEAYNHEQCTALLSWSTSTTQWRYFSGCCWKFVYIYANW